MKYIYLLININGMKCVLVYQPKCYLQSINFSSIRTDIFTLGSLFYAYKTLNLSKIYSNHSRSYMI